MAIYGADDNDLPLRRHAAALQIRALLAPDDSQNFSADVLTAFLIERIGGRMSASIRFPGIEVPQDECAHSGTLPCVRYF